MIYPMCESIGTPPPPPASFLFQACREEGLLGPSGLVRVRARALKAHERERYTVDRCSLQAKFLFAPKPATATGPTRQDPNDDVPLVRPHPLPKGTPLSTTAEEVGARRRSSSPAAAAAAAAVPVATASATISAALAGATTAEIAPAEEAATSVGETQDLPPENKDEGQECRSARSADNREGGARRLEEEQRECQEEEEEDCCSSRIQGKARSGGQGAGERDPGIVRVTSSGQTAPRSRAKGTWDGKPAESGSGGEETPDGTEGTAEALTSTYAQRRSKKKGGRRKKGGGGQSGGGEQRARAGVLTEAAVDEMPGDLSRKQERSRNGRRRQAPMM